MDDKFQFVFTQIDALEAVADIRRRLDLAAVFGYSDAYRERLGHAPGQMLNEGWWFDEVTEHWLPQWFPGWAK